MRRWNWDRIGIVVLLGGLLAINAWTAFVHIQSLRLLTSAPFHFSADQAVAEPPVACPGQDLTVAYDVIVLPVFGDGRSIVVGIYETWWSVDRGATVVREAQPHYAIWRLGAETYAIEVRRSRPVPDLPPGRYELRIAGATSGQAAAMISAPFTVPEACPLASPPGGG